VAQYGVFPASAVQRLPDALTYAQGAALRVADALDMLRQAARLLHAGGERAERGAKALAFAEQHRGAARRTMNLLRPYLEKNS